MVPEIYKQDHGDKISKIFYESIRKSWGVSIAEMGDGFRSVRIRKPPSPDAVFGMCCDGIGTKVEVAELMNYFSFLGHDLVAMVCDDASAMGAVPFMMTTTLDFGTLEQNDIPYDKIETLAKGLSDGARIANVPVVAGESGQMGSRINGRGKLPILWNASLTWWANRDSIITGEQIESKDFIVSLPEPNCRSNGYTLIRNIAEDYAGPDWVNKICPGTDSTFGSLAMQPSQIYTPIIQELLKTDIPIHGMIHITGGGLEGRLRSYLGRYGLGANINNAYPAGLLFQSAIESGLVGIKMAYETWCMGNGFLIITPQPSDVQSIITENRYKSKIIGEITEDKSIRISSNLSLKW